MSKTVVSQEDAVEDVDFKSIELEGGLIAWVSPQDEGLGRMGWRAKKSGKGKWHHYYAVHSYRIAGERGEYYLHNLVWEKMNATILPKGFLVDHINQDKLDNRRENLRLASRSDNEANKRKRRTQSGGKTTSQYKGVTKMSDGLRSKPWRATITFEHKQTALGTFEHEIDAARAYDKAALEIYGEFSFINFPEEHKNDD